MGFINDFSSLLYFDVVLGVIIIEIHFSGKKCKELNEMSYSSWSGLLYKMSNRFAWCDVDWLEAVDCSSF